MQGMFFRFPFSNQIYAFMNLFSKGKGFVLVYHLKYIEVEEFEHILDQQCKSSIDLKSMHVSQSL